MSKSELGREAEFKFMSPPLQDFIEFDLKYLNKGLEGMITDKLI